MDFLSFFILYSFLFQIKNAIAYRKKTLFSKIVSKPPHRHGTFLISQNAQEAGQGC